ncbi:cytochrome-c peroxidase [Adhaeribacter soli]|uniref:Methylamine utilization protein MauG n=1 Tax=Adhaeribacter soli TaxID=2607655 RepID=A0A5N1J020_9BACT|nr:cytochrome c peroxidase [Adhaeribacter soli]KAA9333593.1 c-type cytochrome [Adhaeribacter soli]
MKQKITLLFSLAFFVFACEKETETAPGTTPYQIELPPRFKTMPVPADNPMTVEGVELGRMLFYEKRLSADNTISCGTCHQQKLAFTDGRDISFGVNGKAGTRSSMSLANVGYFETLMWDGRDTTLEKQAKGPIENPVEMHQSLLRAVNKLQNTQTYPPLFLKAFGSKIITEENVLKALAQFQRTLISGNSRFDQFEKQNKTNALTQSELNGKRLFFQHPNADPFDGPVIRGGNCGDCHAGDLLAPKRMLANNGLDVEFKDNGFGDITGSPFDQGKFKVPSLRNIALTAPYMHDGRFKTLEEVLNHYNDHVKKNSPNLASDMTASNEYGTNQQLGLTEQEKKDIIAFLHTLTDDTFINDPRFSDPFEKTGMVK